MAKEYIKKEVSKVTVFEKMICDMCGKESSEDFWEEGNYRFFSTVFLNTTYDHDENLGTDEYDICPQCFRMLESTIKTFFKEFNPVSLSQKYTEIIFNKVLNRIDELEEFQEENIKKIYDTIYKKLLALTASFSFNLPELKEFYTIDDWLMDNFNPAKQELVDCVGFWVQDTKAFKEIKIGTILDEFQRLVYFGIKNKRDNS